MQNGDGICPNFVWRQVECAVGGHMSGAVEQQLGQRPPLDGRQVGENWLPFSWVRKARGLIAPKLFHGGVEQVFNPEFLQGHGGAPFDAANLSHILSAPGPPDKGGGNNRWMGGKSAAKNGGRFPKKPSAVCLVFNPSAPCCRAASCRHPAAGSNSKTVDVLRCRFRPTGSRRWSRPIRPRRGCCRSGNIRRRNG